MKLFEQYDNNSDAKKYHGQYAINEDDLIGVILLWDWKGVFLFGSEKYTEKDGFIEYPLDSFETGKLKHLSREEFDVIFNERNIKEGEEGSRSLEFGKIHDNIMQASFEFTPNQTYWSYDFCRSYASMIANEKVLEELKEKHDLNTKEEIETFTKEHNGEMKEIFIKHHISDGCTYVTEIDKILDGEVSIPEAKQKVEYFKNILPREYQTVLGEEMETLLGKKSN